MREILLPLLCVLLAACDPSWPGDPVGSFDVVGRLEENGCGEAAVPAVESMRFSVELRVGDGQVVWRRPGQPLIEGSTDDAGVFTFRQQRSIALLGPDPDTGRAGCDLAQVEIVHVELSEVSPDDGGVAATSDAGPNVETDPNLDAGPHAELALTGDNAMQLAPIAGSDCTRALASAGGVFTALPCTVSYSLHGTPRPPF